MSKVAAVVVTYNRAELLKECLASLQGQSAPCDILVVDNHSTDGTGEWLAAYAAEHENMRFFSLPENIGGAGGFNFGMRRAVEEGFEYVWLMDDDCLPHPDALEKLLEADEILHGEYGWLSSAALWTDGKECKMNRQKLRKNYYEQMELVQYGLVAAEQATFVSCFLRAETVREAGLPIKDFFIWGDDIEYTRRIAVRMQKRSYLCGQSVVVHAMANNDGSSIAKDAPERIDRYNYAFRNENYLYRKEGFKGFCYYFAKCGVNGLRVLANAENHRAKRCGVIVKQFFGGLFFAPEIEYVGEKEHEV